MKPVAPTLAALASLAFSGIAAASELPTDAYLAHPPTGTVVMDTFGNCVRTTAWSPEKMIGGCGKVAKPVPVAAPAAPAPRVVIAPPPAPPLAVSPPPPPPPVPAIVQVKTKQMRAVTLQSDALFAFDSAQFNREGQPGDLEKLAQRLSALEAVQVVGHTDSTGSSAYNERLALRRAESVKDYLVKRGIDPSKITILGMGERSPAADNTTAEGRAKNRRVVIMVKGLAEGN